MAFGKPFLLFVYLFISLGSTRAKRAADDFKREVIEALICCFEKKKPTRPPPTELPTTQRPIVGGEMFKFTLNVGCLIAVLVHDNS